MLPDPQKWVLYGFWWYRIQIWPFRINCITGNGWKWWFLRKNALVFQKCEKFISSASRKNSMGIIMVLIMQNSNLTILNWSQNRKWLKMAAHFLTNFKDIISRAISPMKMGIYIMRNSFLTILDRWHDLK